MRHLGIPVQHRRPYRSDCTKFALIGLGIRIALSVIGYIAMLPFTAMLY